MLYFLIRNELDMLCCKDDNNLDYAQAYNMLVPNLAEGFVKRDMGEVLAV